MENKKISVKKEPWGKVAKSIAIKDSKESKATKVSKDTKNTEDILDTKGVENTKDTEEIKGPEDTKCTEDTKGTEDTKDPKDTEDTKGTEDTKNPEDTEDTKYTEDTEGTKDTKHTDASKYSKDTNDDNAEDVGDINEAESFERDSKAESLNSKDNESDADEKNKKCSILGRIFKPAVENYFAREEDESIDSLDFTSSESSVEKDLSFRKRSPDFDLENEDTKKRARVTRSAPLRELSDSSGSD